MRSLSLTIEYSLKDFAVATDCKGRRPRSLCCIEILETLNGKAEIMEPQRYQFGLQWISGTYLCQWNNTRESSRWNVLSVDLLEMWMVGHSLWGSAVENSWTAPHDVQTLILWMGGPKATEKRLDKMNHIWEITLSEQAEWMALAPRYLILAMNLAFRLHYNI